MADQPAEDAAGQPGDGSAREEEEDDTPMLSPRGPSVQKGLLAEAVNNMDSADVAAAMQHGVAGSDWGEDSDWDYELDNIVDVGAGSRPGGAAVLMEGPPAGACSLEPSPRQSSLAFPHRICLACLRASPPQINIRKLIRAELRQSLRKVIARQQRPATTLMRDKLTFVLGTLDLYLSAYWLGAWCVRGGGAPRDGRWEGSWRGGGMPRWKLQGLRRLGAPRDTVCSHPRPLTPQAESLAARGHGALTCAHGRACGGVLPCWPGPGRARSVRPPNALPPPRTPRPDTFYRLYTVKAAVLFCIRWVVYRYKKWHYYLFDLCYAAQLLLLLQLWAFPTNITLVKARGRGRAGITGSLGTRVAVRAGVPSPPSRCRGNDSFPSLLPLLPPR